LVKIKEILGKRQGKFLGKTGSKAKVRGLWEGGGSRLDPEEPVMNEDPQGGGKIGQKSPEKRYSKNF